MPSQSAQMKVQWGKLIKIIFYVDNTEKYFHNRIFPSLELLIDVLCQGLNTLADDAERLRALTSFPHLRVAI
jgi:hypothetical protein